VDHFKFNFNFKRWRWRRRRRRRRWRRSARASDQSRVLVDHGMY
jgi:hypothetical protein